jgi:hypothetical protein
MSCMHGQQHLLGSRPVYTLQVMITGPIQFLKVGYATQHSHGYTVPDKAGIVERENKIPGLWRN